MKIIYNNSEFTLQNQPLLGEVINPLFELELNNIEDGAFTVQIVSGQVKITYLGVNEVTLIKDGNIIGCTPNTPTPTPTPTVTFQISLTYAQLIARISASTLVSGTQYEITDFQTTHYKTTTYTAPENVNVGQLEPLIVTATSNNTIDKVAYSPLYPQDIIHYDWNAENWLTDQSLSNTGVIIAGWKGVIYFRHDTLLDNYAHNDFRKSKYRRYKENVPAYNSATIYGVNEWVKYEGVLYFSLKANNEDNSPTSTSVWGSGIDTNQTAYICHTGSNIPHDLLDYTDVPMFVSSLMNEYDSYIRGVKVERNIARLYNDIVFYIANEDYTTIGKSFFGTGLASMTFVGDFESLTFGNDNGNLTFGNVNSGLTFGNNNNNSTFGNNNYSLTFGNDNSGLTFGNNNYSLTFGNDNSGLTFGNDNSGLTFGNNNYSLTFGNANYDLTFGNDNSGLTFGNNNYSLTFGNANGNLTFGNDNGNLTFGNNNEGDLLALFGDANGNIVFADSISLDYDYSASPITYALFQGATTKNVFKNTLGIPRVSYFDATDTLVVSPINI